MLSIIVKLKFGIHVLLITFSIKKNYMIKMIVLYLYRKPEVNKKDFATFAKKKNIAIHQRKVILSIKTRYYYIYDMDVHGISRSIFRT